MAGVIYLLAVWLFVAMGIGVEVVIVWAWLQTLPPGWVGRLWRRLTAARGAGWRV